MANIAHMFMLYICYGITYYFFMNVYISTYVQISIMSSCHVNILNLQICNLQKYKYRLGNEQPLSFLFLRWQCNYYSLQVWVLTDTTLWAHDGESMWIQYYFHYISWWWCEFHVDTTSWVQWAIIQRITCFHTCTIDFVLWKPASCYVNLNKKCSVVTLPAACDSNMLLQPK